MTKVWIVLCFTSLLDCLNHALNPRSRGHENRDRALLVSGQTAGTIAGAGRVTRSTNSAAIRQARPLVMNASR